MWKQIFAVIILSILVVLGAKHVGAGMHGLSVLHSKILSALSLIFAGGSLATMIRQVLSLLVIPVGSALLVMLIGWLLHRDVKAYFVIIMWVLWLLLVATLTTMAAIPAA